MLEKFEAHINDKFPEIYSQKILLAISGGIDSVVLAHLFNKLKINFSFAHCNFRLRGVESDLDEQFVKDLSNNYKIKTHVTSFNTENYAKSKKTSTQLAARELRYNWFHQILDEYKYNKLATAHHADDNLETFLINLTRGTGLEGFTGIPEKTNKLIRPLLPFSREEIEQYALKHKIKWREDSSNNSTKYLRNKIRHEVIPILKEISPALLKNFNNTTNYLKESQEIIDDRIKDISKNIITKEDDVIKINIKKLEALPNPKAYLYQFLKGHGFSEWDKVTKLLRAQSGKFISTNSHILLKNREFLLFSRFSSDDLLKNSIPVIEEGTKVINHPIQLTISNTTETMVENKNSIIVDKNLLFFPLRIRRWRNGDVFYPSGMTGRKKVSKFFKDEKLSRFEKEKAWLLCTADDKIIWIIGMRQDRRFKVNSKTSKLIKISK